MVNVQSEDLLEVSDEVLISKLAGDSEAALSQLFRRYYQRIWNIGKRVLRNGWEADDLVQEVFLYIHRKYSLFDESKGSARSWIIQVAYTQALLRRRRLKAQGFYASNCSAKLEARTSDSLDPVQGFLDRNVWKYVVNDLTKDQRETLRLHFFEGLTFAEIAEKLGQSSRNIRNHHYRGLEKLRKHLGRGELNGR
jgi:RNA polymerase sigma-70 factor, ECF subfamily